MLKPVIMARKSWSNLFLFMGALNVALALAPRNPVRMIDWIAIPCFRERFVNSILC